MKAVYQKGRPFGCMAACVASILEIDLADVPRCFDGRTADDEDAWDRDAQLRWLAGRGYGAIEFKLLTGVMWPPTPGIYCIVTGRSPRGTMHAVVGATREMPALCELIHDPFWDQALDRPPPTAPFFHGREPAVITFLLPLVSLVRE